MRVMAFDPGLTTGWFVGDADKEAKTVKMISYGEEMEWGGLGLFFLDVVNERNVKLLLVENIVVHGMLNLDKVAQIAAWTHVRTVAHMTGKSLRIISPEERKRTAFVSKSGVPAAMRHARDAAKLAHVWVQQP